MKISPAEKKKGFSLLEMTVVLGIVAIMTAIILLNLPQMKGGISVDIVAQEIAIYIRGAQVYSRSTKVGPIQDQEHFYSFGMHFDREESEFFLWSDENNSAYVDPITYCYQNPSDNPPDDVPAESYSLPSGFKISDLVIEYFQSGAIIKEPGKTSIDILFKKPEPEAYFCSEGAMPESEKIPTAVVVKLTSANQAVSRWIKVSNNGQITVLKSYELPE